MICCLVAFKIFRFSSNSNCWHGGIKYLRVLCYGGIYIGNDNVEDDESPSSSPKCQKKINLFFDFMSKVLKKETLIKTVKVPFEIVN